jgi:catechol-2,3-dioxygenase
VTAPFKLGHVAFRTGDVARLRAWYCTVLEADVVFENDFVGFLTYDDEHHRIAIINRGTSDHQDADSGTLDHVSFTYESLGDLLDTYERLAGEGITPTRTINHGPTTSMYYNDPDGNGVELQIDNFETAEETTAFILSDTFRENPIGVLFDADRLVERFCAGDPLSELIKQGSA